MKHIILSILFTFSAIFSQAQQTIPSGGTVGQVLTKGASKLLWSNPVSLWGGIGGLLSNQADLQNALNAKVTANSSITGATKTKITYDAKGLVTSGADATTSDIAEGSNLYYTSSRFNTSFAAKSTTDLTEGSNLYFTNGRAQSAMSGLYELPLTFGRGLKRSTNTVRIDTSLNLYWTAPNQHTFACNILPEAAYTRNIGSTTRSYNIIYAYEFNVYNGKLRITETSNIATLFGTAGIDFSNNGNYNLRMGTDGHSKFPTAPPVTANYGLVSLGNGAFNGSTAGFFTGSANGTVIAANITGSADLVNLEKSGVDRFKVDNDGNTTAVKYCLTDLNTAPASASATGTKGEIRVTATYIYVCTATNTWVRAALSTW